MFRSPLFGWSPRPSQDPFATPPTQSSSRFGAFRNSVRAFALNGSSIYSQSPTIGASNNNTPKVPFLGSPSRQPSPNQNTFPATHDTPAPIATVQPQHTAGSYMREIGHGPQMSSLVHNRHPADVPLPLHYQDTQSETIAQQSADDVENHKRRRKHKKRKNRHHANHWVRRRNDSSRNDPGLFTKTRAARGKMIACVISGVLLLTVLAIYLSIALTRKTLGEEIHILFILVLLLITIFFCHSLIRLCMLMLNPPRESSRPRVPAITGSDGFQPIIPIRVRLARDEEARTAETRDLECNNEPEDPEKTSVIPPPPAYGLWRSSVRADPNLLHWRRVEQDTRAPNHASERDVSAPTRPRPSTDGPRPPSYVSEDGVGYIMEAAPRSTVEVRASLGGNSNIHPAWRPGYAMSEIRGDEPGWPLAPGTARRM